MFEAVKRWSILWFGSMALACGAAAQVATTPLTFSGTTAVGTTTPASATVTLTAQASGTITSVAAAMAGWLPAVIAGDPTTLDFSVTSNTCGSSISSGSSCEATVTFSPRFPGVRQGTVVIIGTVNGSSNQVLASVPISGVGQGSLPVLVPAVINTVAGDAQWIYQGDNIAATQAPIFLPSGLAVDAVGNLFLCDSSNNRVREVKASNGYIYTVAGTGTPGGGGDNNPAVDAELSNPSGIVVDGAGNLFIADNGNSVIRRVDAVTGIITTFAGQNGTAGYSGDGGAATSALLNAPRGLALTPGGDLVIADSGNNAVRVVNITTGKINTVAGDDVAGAGVAGYSGDGGSAVGAKLNDPYGVAVRADGAIAIADLENQRVRLVNTSGQISTMAGTGGRNYSGDGGSPTSAELNGPADVAFDPAGDLFIADSGNNCIRMIFGNKIETVVGNGTESFGGDGGPSNQAVMYGPYGVFFDQSGNIWISDTFNNRIREVFGSLLYLYYPNQKVDSVSTPPTVEGMYSEGNANLVLSMPVPNQAALDTNTTTCNQTAMAPMTSCTMGIEFAPTQVSSGSGTNAIPILGSITWPSNAPNVTPVDHLSGVVLSVNVTAVTLSGSPNPGLVGNPVTLSAAVTGGTAGLTGSITFSEGNNVWCSQVAVSASATATCTIQSLTLGSHTFTASYSGDANNAASTSPAYTEIIKQQPALVLSVSPRPGTVQSSVTLMLNTIDQSGTATGSVSFYDGTTELYTMSLNGSGVAQWSTSTLAVGIHSLSASYAGDGANMSGTSNVVNEQINKATTTTTVASSASTATVGVPVTFTATVTNGGGPAISGAVNFSDGTTIIGSAPVSNGSCSITGITLPAGSYNIVAEYVGDNNNLSSNSAPLVETIQQIATVTSLQASPNPLSAGATLQLTATVAMAQGATADGALTGTVTFKNGATTLGTGTLNSGVATLPVTDLNVGTYSLTATYNGNTNYATSTSIAVNETVQQTPTQTTLSSASLTTLMGKPATFTVSVSSSTGTPTGEVSFYNGATLLGTQNLNGGTATYSNSALPRGTDSITAKYLGNSNYASSTSAPVLQVVQLAQPTLILSGPTSAVDAGTAAQFIANLTTPGISPTGTLTLLNGGSVVATLNVTGDGNYAFSTTTLTVGTHTITATYGGDGNNSPATSAALTVVVRQASTTTALTSSADPLTQGTPLTLTATVSSDSPNETGQVRFLDGTTLLGTGTLANGAATFSPSGLALGTHTITAVYSGDTNHVGSTSSPLTELVVQTTTATLTSNNNPAESGQNVTFTATLSGASKLIPTGTATFRDNGSLLATITLSSSGTASFTTNALSVASHTISMNYSGDENFAVTEAQLIETVTNANTQVVISAGANPATYGQSLALTATVTSKGGTATGAVIFTDAGTTIGSAKLDAEGVAVLTIATLAPGVHSIVATYPGDGKASPSVSTPLSLTVKQATTLAIISNNNPAFTLSAIGLTAKVTNAGASPATGTVSFTDGGAAIGSAPIDSTGNATLALAQMTAGVHQIVASYPGDGTNFASASASFTQTVQLRPTTTTVTGSSTDTANPQQVTLIAVVDGTGSVMPGGTVTFTSGNVTLGKATVGDTGVATITVIFSQPTQVVIASYSGDVNYAASASSSKTLAAGEAAQFTLAVTAPSVTVVTHQHATINVNLGSVKGFTDTIELGCVGLPYAGTCTFTPSEVKLSPNGTATASLVLDTGDPLGSGSGTNALLVHGRSTFLCCLPIGLLAFLVRRKELRAARSKLAAFLVLTMAIAFSVGLSGCSGLTTNATPAGTYTLKVVGTGQGSGISETQTITLVVTQ